MMSERKMTKYKCQHNRVHLSVSEEILRLHDEDCPEKVNDIFYLYDLRNIYRV